MAYKTYSEKLKNPLWQKKRLEILNRDEFSCQMCGSTEKTLHVHHLAYHSEPWETPNHLLETLCDECHKYEEEALKDSIQDVAKYLKLSGFKSMGFYALTQMFNTDRGWKDYEPAFDILHMIISDDVLWRQMHDEFFKRLRAGREDKNG